MSKRAAEDVCDPRAPKRMALSLGPDLITIKVGTQQQSYCIHSQLLCADSQFFRSATKKEWKEGQNREIALPEDTTEVFDIYIQWLYQKKILCQIDDSNPVDKEVSDQYRLLIDVFIFGDKVQDIPLKDATINALCNLSDLRNEKNLCIDPTGVNVTRAYRGTMPGSPLRKFFATLYSWFTLPSWSTKECPVELKDAVLVALLSRRVATPPWWQWQPCSMHEHIESYICPVED
ncbi:hypothetical protein AMS68_002185 [Peltaster fructicola]|uniref:BTB domain-containing protein n=1 Tax=Peltaster fructicola TaxID=286661 RepID=A0A6H0XPV7_9PEZI|nr:hypothetical protein AMS68_002185 [Peltaster fructicola]